MADQGGRGPRSAARAAALPPLAAPLARPLVAGDWRRWLARCAEQELEHRRLFPWLAVAFGLGILLFFAAEDQPALWAPVAGAVAAAAAAVAARHRLISFAAALGVAAVFLGFSAGALRIRAVEAPVLGRITIAALAGFVESVEERAEGARLVVRLHELAGVAAERRPRRVRVTMRDRQSLRAGDFIGGTARLLPPPEAAWPGGYDFARDAYFRGIGAVGSLVGRVETTPPPVAPDRLLQIAARVDDARNVLTRRIAEAIGGQAGAVAAALVTGKRGLISEDTNDALRAAGIYHIVSISGLHMVLAAGTMFWLARALLALVPALALLWPIKKIAAVAAMLGAASYCIFSGSEVATERALVMTLVMLGAILVDRPALTMRNLALSALIVLAREPEALLGPSFQMSYAAVAALIASAEWAHSRLPAAEPGGLVHRSVRWAVVAGAALLATTPVATLATGPFGSYHFHTVNPFGLIGNALAVPLVSLVVMPCAVVAMLAFPFGLDRPVWELMGFAVAKVLGVSQWVSEFAGSTIVVPAFPVQALALMALGLVTITILVSPLRLAALLPAAAGLWLAATPMRFDIYVDRDGAGAAVRAATRRLVMIGRTPAFVVDQWLKAEGDGRKPDDVGLRAGARCDQLGCVAALADGRMVALVTDRRAFAEDCRRAALVISRLPAPATCKPPLLLDRRFLDLHGATALRFTPSGHEIIATRAAGEARPWLRRSAPARSSQVRAPEPRETPAMPPEPSMENLEPRLYQ
jgi:competence protein ComEC